MKSQFLVLFKSKIKKYYSNKATKIEYLKEEL